MSEKIRSRKWFGTVWEENDIDYLKKLKYQYILISALDRTSEEHQGIRRDHWHVFIQFKSNRPRPRTTNAHWEIPNHINGAVQYCRDKGQPTFEEGSLGINSGDKEDWEGFVEAAKKLPKEELLQGTYSKMIAMYPKFADLVYTVANKPDVIQGPLQHLWIYGKAGCGKTSWVWEQVGPENLYVKNANKWWDGYAGQPFVLIDDWDKNHQVLAHHLKQWADRYPFQGEMKGAGRIMRPEHIIVTSNYSIEQCFENQEDVEAFNRRFIIVNGRPTSDIYSILGGDGNTGDAPHRVSQEVSDEMRYFMQGLL